MQWDEGTIQFDFGSRWVVEKLDEHKHYREGIEKLDGTKAVDFIGVFDDDDLYLICTWSK
jgi:hypothetical protein